MYLSLEVQFGCVRLLVDSRIPDNCIFSRKKSRIIRFSLNELSLSKELTIWSPQNWKFQISRIGITKSLLNPCPDKTSGEVIANFSARSVQEEESCEKKLQRDESRLTIREHSQPSCLIWYSQNLYLSYSHILYPWVDRIILQKVTLTVIIIKENNNTCRKE